MAAEDLPKKGSHTTLKLALYVGDNHKRSAYTNSLVPVSCVKTVLGIGAVRLAGRWLAGWAAPSKV